MSMGDIDLKGDGGLDDASHLWRTIDASPDWRWEIDAAWRYTTPSQKRAELFGLSQTELIGQSILHHMSVGDAQRITAIFDRIRTNPRPFSGLICRYTRPNGLILVLETTGIPLLDNGGVLSGYRGFDRDITPTGLLSLDGRLSQLETIYATLPIALCVIGRDGRLLAVNNVHATLADRPISSLIGTYVRDVHAEGGRNITRDFSLFDAGGSVPDHELIIRDRTYLVSVAPLRNAFGYVEAISVAHTDITERKYLERELEIVNQRLRDLASRDHLTGLFNRRYFDEVIAREVENIHCGYRPLSTIIFDIDYFKQYNDHYGHLAGDNCLECVARCTTAALAGTGAIVCRHGGEEFAAILPGSAGDAAMSAAGFIHQAVIDLNREHAASPLGFVTISIGVASLISMRQEADVAACGDALFKAADDALYVAKKEGRNRIRVAQSLCA